MKEAQEELEKWREERAKKLEAKAEMNRQEEEKLIEGNKEDMACANPWERVNKLVDMNAETSHNMSRMKQVMIRMKGDAAKMQMVFLFVDHFLFMKRSHIDENKSIDPFQDFCNQFAFGRNSKRNDVTPSKIPKTDGTDQVQTESDLRKDHDLDPFVAPYPNKYRDKFCSPCSTCFNQWYAIGMCCYNDQ